MKAKEKRPVGKCNGIMAVPITALDKLDLGMFELVGVLNKPVIKGKALYKRLLIRRRNLP